MTVQRCSIGLAFTVIALGLLPAAAHTAPAAGRLSILADVHGYATNNRVVVPLRGIAEWLGATVQYDRPRISVSLGSTEMSLAVGASTASINGRTTTLDAPARVHGGITCVPVRFVCESLGIDVTYHSEESDQAAALDGIPSVQLAGRGKSGRVLIHEEPPNVVGGIVGDLESTQQRDLANADMAPFALGTYGTDWVLQVTRIVGGHFMSSEPARWGAAFGDEECFFSHAWGIYGQRDGKWRFLTGGQNDPGRRQWSQAGIPVQVARQMGITLAAGY